MHPRFVLFRIDDGVESLGSDGCLLANGMNL